jgi:hypothetical protein
MAGRSADIFYVEDNDMIEYIRDFSEFEPAYDGS